MTGKWLLIDDIRSLRNIDAIVRDPELAKRMLENFEWEGIIFDHDFGENLVDGYKLLTYMLITLNKRPKYVQLITDNPVGRSKMENTLVDFGYRKANPREFVYDTNT